MYNSDEAQEFSQGALLLYVFHVQRTQVAQGTLLTHRPFDSVDSPIYFVCFLPLRIY